MPQSAQVALTRLTKALDRHRTKPTAETARHLKRLVDRTAAAIGDEFPPTEEIANWLNSHTPPELFFEIAPCEDCGKPTLTLECTAPTTSH